MKIQPVNVYSYNSKLHNYHNSQNKRNENMSFTAKELRVFEEVQNSILSKESLPRFKKVMELFEKKLIADKKCPEEIVSLHSPTWDAPINTAYGKKKADILMIAGDRGVNFYYNVNRTVNEISDDLYNTYLHLLSERRKPNATIESDPIGDFVSYYQTRMP